MKVGDLVVRNIPQFPEIQKHLGVVTKIRHDRASVEVRWMTGDLSKSVPLVQNLKVVSR